MEYDVQYVSEDCKLHPVSVAVN